MLIHPPPRRSVPRAPAQLRHPRPARSPQTGTRLLRQRVSDQALITQRLSRPPDSPIQATTSVPSAESADPSHLQRQPIIQPPSHRPTSHRYPHQRPTPIRQPHPELPATNTAIMPMVLHHKSVSLPQGDRNKPIHTPTIGTSTPNPPPTTPNRRVHRPPDLKQHPVTCKQIQPRHPESPGGDQEDE